MLHRIEQLLVGFGNMFDILEFVRFARDLQASEECLGLQLNQRPPHSNLFATDGN